jgi:hypothetical protein
MAPRGEEPSSSRTRSTSLARRQRYAHFRDFAVASTTEGAPDRSLRPCRITRSAAPGCPVAGEPPRRPVDPAPNPGFRVAALASGSPPRRSRRGRLVAERARGPWIASAETAHTVPGSPGAATGPKPSVFPATDSRRPRRAGAGPVGHQARWPSPGPSWPWETPGLHGHPTGRFRRPLQESGTMPSCASSCSTIPARAGLVVVVIVPIEPVDRSTYPPSRAAKASRPRGRPRYHPSGGSYDVSFEFPKIAPPLSREPRSPRPAGTSP